MTKTYCLNILICCLLLQYKIMTKVWVLAPNENWIVDRFAKEWYEDNKDISTSNINDANVIWALADWCFDKISQQILQQVLLGTKKIVTTIHHITPEKFGFAEKNAFALRDKYTTLYHVYNERTLEFVKQYTTKKVVLIPYWANQKIFYPLQISKQLLRTKHNITQSAYLVGSFQRDTEGSSISSGNYLPKLEKGPDLFVDAIIELSKKHSNIEVLLAGWRRQYVIKRLTDHDIKYHYFELPSQEIINELYQTLDLYLVTARYEGGPQSLLECGLCNTPVISSAVGIAEQVLSSSAISSDVLLATPEIPNIKNMILPQGYNSYRELFLSL